MAIAYIVSKSANGKTAEVVLVTQEILSLADEPVRFGKKHSVTKHVLRQTDGAFKDASGRTYRVHSDR